MDTRPQTPEEHAHMAFGRCISAPLTFSQLKREILIMLRGHWSNRANHGVLSRALCREYSADQNNKDALPVDMAYSSKFRDAKTEGIWLSVSGSEMIEKSGIGRTASVSQDSASEFKVWAMEPKILVTHTFESAEIAEAAAESTALWMAGISTLLHERPQQGYLHSMGPTHITDTVEHSKTPRLLRVDTMGRIGWQWVVEVRRESHQLKSIDFAQQAFFE